MLFDMVCKHSVTSKQRQKASESCKNKSLSPASAFLLCFISTCRLPTVQPSHLSSALFSTSLSDPARGFSAFEKESSSLPQINTASRTPRTTGLLAVRNYYYFFFAATYLKAFPDRLQQVGHQGVVPQVGEPHPRTFHVHGARQEETWTCRNKQKRTGV